MTGPGAIRFMPEPDAHITIEDCPSSMIRVPDDASRAVTIRRCQGSTIIVERAPAAPTSETP